MVESYFNPQYRVAEHTSEPVITGEKFLTTYAPDVSVYVKSLVSLTTNFSRDIGIFQPDKNHDRLRHDLNLLYSVCNQAVGALDETCLFIEETPAEHPAPLYHDSLRVLRDIQTKIKAIQAQINLNRQNPVYTRGQLTSIGDLLYSFAESLQKPLGSLEYPEFQPPSLLEKTRARQGREQRENTNLKNQQEAQATQARETVVADIMANPPILLREMLAIKGYEQRHPADAMILINYATEHPDDLAGLVAILDNKNPQTGEPEHLLFELRGRAFLKASIQAIYELFDLLERNPNEAEMTAFLEAVPSICQYEISNIWQQKLSKLEAIRSIVTSQLDTRRIKPVFGNTYNRMAENVAFALLAEGVTQKVKSGETTWPDQAAKDFYMLPRIITQSYLYETITFSDNTCYLYPTVIVSENDAQANLNELFKICPQLIQTDSDGKPHLRDFGTNIYPIMFGVTKTIAEYLKTKTYDDQEQALQDLVRLTTTYLLLLNLDQVSTIAQKPAEVTADQVISFAKA